MAKVLAPESVDTVVGRNGIIVPTFDESHVKLDDVNTFIANLYNLNSAKPYDHHDYSLKEYQDMNGDYEGGVTIPASNGSPFATVTYSKRAGDLKLRKEIGTVGRILGRNNLINIISHTQNPFATDFTSRLSGRADVPLGQQGVVEFNGRQLSHPEIPQNPSLDELAEWRSVSATYIGDQVQVVLHRAFELLTD